MARLDEAIVEGGPPRSRTRNGRAQGGDLGFEAKLWLAADKLRSNPDSAE